MFFRAFVSLAVAAIGLSTTGCSIGYPAVEAIALSTAPPGVNRPQVTWSERTGQMMEFTWEFDTRFAPAEYVNWVAGRLVPRFRISARQADELGAAAYENGEALRIVLSVREIGSLHHVNARLTVMPD
jgi:hypothetical protein